MGKRSRRARGASLPAEQLEVSKILRRLGLPRGDDVGYLISSIAGALPAEILAEFDDLEGDESARLDIALADSETALWLIVGLRLPMIRAQLPWVLERLTALSLTEGSAVLDVGSGGGLTSAVVANTSIVESSPWSLIREQRMPQSRLPSDLGHTSNLLRDSQRIFRSWASTP